MPDNETNKQKTEFQSCSHAEPTSDSLALKVTHAHSCSTLKHTSKKMMYKTKQTILCNSVFDWLDHGPI